MPVTRRRPSALRVAVVDGRGRPVHAPGLAKWLEGVAPARAAGRVTVAMVADPRMRALNRTYRGKDAVTDVLSFPAAAAPVADGGGRFLGDIVIASGRARTQARAAGHAESVEWRVLALHGLLHVIGYDHETDNGAMARVETRLRRAGGLERGLIERSPAR